MDHLESFQNARMADRLQALAQVVLVFLILGAINYIAMRSYQRYDLTKNNTYTLSPETKAYLKDLDRPIKVIVTLAESPEDPSLVDALKDIRLTLREYEYATRDQGDNRITIEYLNIYSQTKRAKDLGIETPNVIAFKAGERMRQIHVSELYSRHGDDQREFLGENAFTRSILELLAASDPVLYFTTGHGEMDANDVRPNAGSSELFNELKSRNFKTKTLDLSANSVPKDAALVVIAAPQSRLLPQEVLALEDYLGKKAGRVLALLEPGQPHGLDDLFFKWGILVDDAIATERDPNFLIGGGDLMIRRFAQHPITSSLAALRIVTDRAQVVRADPGRPLNDSLVVTELLATSDKSWGEKSHQTRGLPTYDAKTDIPGPVTIAAIAEQQIDSSLGISLPGGRLIAIGTANFATNNRIHAAGNLYLLLNAINHSLDRATRLNIPPRPINKVKLDVSIEELHLARYLIWFSPPALVGIFGLSIYLARRN